MAIATLDVSKRLDIVAKEGDDFQLNLEVKNADGSPYNFSGCVVELVVKTARKENLPTILKFSSADTSIVLTSGNITILKPRTDLMNKSGKYVYDLFITKNNKTTTWLSSDFILRPKAYSITY